MCNYILGEPCEYESDAVKCAKVPAVKCHEKREKLLNKQKEDGYVEDCTVHVTGLGLE